MANKTYSNTFCDVEHDGDIQQIRDVIHKFGGKVLHEDFQYEQEMIDMRFELPENAFAKMKADTEDEDAHFYFSRYINN